MTDERIGPIFEDERAEAYLDGELSRHEAAAFERDLASRPEVAEALGAAILLRDLLGRMPPLHPPPGLEQRILRALALGRPEERPEALGAGASARPSAVAAVRAAFSGASWLFRSPATVMQGGIGGARPIAAGLTQLRWVLGPMAARRAESGPSSRRPAWRRLLGSLGTLGRLGGLG